MPVHAIATSGQRLHIPTVHQCCWASPPSPAPASHPCPTDQPDHRGPGRRQHSALRGGVHSTQADQRDQHMGGRHRGRRAAAHGLGSGHRRPGRGSRCAAGTCLQASGEQWCGVCSQAGLPGGPLHAAVRICAATATCLLPAPAPINCPPALLPFCAAILGAGLYFWQMPHFMALAWMCKADYTGALWPANKECSNIHSCSLLCSH